MRKVAYNESQQKLLSHVKTKVKQVFGETPVPAHGFDHIGRVVAWVRQISRGANARHPFLCELAGWLHDIGRAREKILSGSDHVHHELSYQMLREWFRDDREFDMLTRAEKIELLYAVRYHWNRTARKYDTAWVLRDADKLDGFGRAGVKRAQEAFGHDEEAWNQNFRYQYSNYLQLETKCAILLVKRYNMLEPLYKVHNQYLRSKIQPIKL